MPQLKEYFLFILKYFKLDVRRGWLEGELEPSGNKKYTILFNPNSI